MDGYVPEYRTPNPNFDQQPGVKGRIYSLHIPYTGDEYLFHYMPIPPPQKAVHATVSKTEIVFTAGGAWHTSDSINAQFDDNLETLEDGIERVEKNVTPFNASLRNVIVARLAHRVETAKKTRKTTEGLKWTPWPVPATLFDDLVGAREQRCRPFEGPSACSASIP